MSDTEYKNKVHELGDVKDWNVIVSGRYGKDGIALYYKHSSEGYKRGGTTYSFIGPYPEKITVHGDIAQARWVAQSLSNQEAGCEGFWKVEGDEDE